MHRLISCLGRLPTWVWIFLAITQLGTLIAAPLRMSELSQALLKMPDRPEYADVREHFQENWRDNRFQLASAAVLAPLFLGLGLWRWSRSRSNKGTKNGPQIAALPGGRS
jgi:hypothetical protein